MLIASQVPARSSRIYPCHVGVDQPRTRQLEGREQGGRARGLREEMDPVREAGRRTGVKDFSLWPAESQCRPGWGERARTKGAFQLWHTTLGASQGTRWGERGVAARIPGGECMREECPGGTTANPSAEPMARVGKSTRAVTKRCIMQPHDDCLMWGKSVFAARK